MLDQLRKYATSWVAQLLMGILVLSFAVWGVNDVFNGFRSNDVAMVGSSAITITDFQRDYDHAITNLSQQVGQAITPDQARQFGLPSQILGRLVSQATLDNAAGKMGIGVSNTELSQKIASDPQFAGSSGKFDKNMLSQVVRQQGYTDDDYIISQRREMMRGQLAQGFAGGVIAPETYLRAVHEYQAEERDVSYLVLTGPAASDIPDPSDTDLNTYFAAHKDEWKAPELRALTYFELSPTDVAQSVEVSDEDAQKQYETTKARFETPETRKIQQIVFKDRAEADAAAAELAAGKTYDQLMADRKMTAGDVDIGTVTKDKVIDPMIADAAFSLALNVPSAVVEGQFGPAILRVVEINPAKLTSFDEAKDSVKKEIALQRAAAEVSSTHDAIEDARAGGGTLAEVGAKYGLKVVTVPAVDKAGRDANGTDIPGLPTGLVVAAFESDVGLENDPIQPDASSYVWYDVTAVTAPADRTLADVRDKVVAAWKDGERTKQLEAKAEAAKQRLNNHEDIAKVAADLGVEVKTATKLTRAAKPEGDISAEPLAAIFAAPKGAATVAGAPAPMTRLVIVVNDVTVPEFNASAPELTSTKQTLDSQFITAFLGLYVTQLQSQTKVTFNQVALQQVLGGVADTGQ